MKVCVVEGTFGIENLRVVDRAEPTPGPGQVRIAVSVASLNYRDLLMVRGHYNPRQPLPLVPLSDGVGLIDAVGDRVDDLAVGDRVVGLFAPRWVAGEPTRDAIRYTRGGPIDGMLAQYVVSDAAGVAKVPSHLSDAEASTLPCAALTAWSALVTYGGIKAGDTVLVQGSGGVASFALDFALMHGARVIATTSCDVNADYLRERGADVVVRYDKTPEWGKAVRKHCGEGVDHVVEVGGAGTLAQSLRAVRPGGTVSLIGVLAGARGPVDLTPVLMSNVRVQGIFVGHREGFVAMTRAIARACTRPRIERVFPLDGVSAAFSMMASATHRGKICVAVSG
ncbi:MAG: NAD(P)-dependent alcohol dehydrogenase [Nannocystaceae bacterium]|nr:NAD(P)-dependent alcohol dehydrogenase [Nannocystaceae bacterium]